MFENLLVTSISYILRSGVRIFTQSTENSEGITKINYGWRKENKSKENIGIQKDYSPLRLISVSNPNIQVSIFFWQAK